MITFDISPYYETPGTFYQVGGGDTSLQCRELTTEQDRIQQEVSKLALNINMRTLAEENAQRQFYTEILAVCQKYGMQSVPSNDFRKTVLENASTRGIKVTIEQN